MNTLDYKKMVEQIDELVNTDFAYEMDLKSMPESKPYTQKEAEQMASIIGLVYLISHCINCRACQIKYLK